MPLIARILPMPEPRTLPHRSPLSSHPATTRSSSRSRARCSASTGPSSACRGTASSSAPEQPRVDLGRVHARDGHGLDATRGGRHGHRPRVRFPTSAGRPCSSPRCAPLTTEARGWCRSAAARSRSRRRACSTAGRATTHWMYAARLAAEYPTDRGASPTSSTSRTVPCSRRRARPRRSTSRSTSCGSDYGSAIANCVARRMVVPPHRDGGQAQFLDQPVPDTGDADTLGPTLDWIVDNLDVRSPIEKMAAHAIDEHPDVHAPVPRRDRHDTAALAARSNASRTRDASSRRPTCRSTASRRRAGSEAPRTSACTSFARSARHRPRTGARSH